MDQLTLFAAEAPASRFPSRDCEKEWTILVATWRSSILRLLTENVRVGSFSRMSLACCLPTKEGTLVPFSGHWGNSGMGSPTECLTLNSLAFHSAAAACSLSDILETGDVPQRFFLSATACKGILRRAEKRGRELPPSLRTALERAAQTTTKPKPDTPSPPPATLPIA